MGLGGTPALREKAGKRELDTEKSFPAKWQLNVYEWCHKIHRSREFVEEGSGQLGKMPQINLVRRISLT